MRLNAINKCSGSCIHLETEMATPEWSSHCCRLYTLLGGELVVLFFAPSQELDLDRRPDDRHRRHRDENGGGYPGQFGDHWDTQSGDNRQDDPGDSARDARFEAGGKKWL